MGERAVCAAGSDSMCRHVRYTSKRRSKMPRRVIEGLKEGRGRVSRWDAVMVFKGWDWDEAWWV